MEVEVEVEAGERRGVGGNVLLCEAAAEMEMYGDETHTGSRESMEETRQSAGEVRAVQAWVWIGKCHGSTAHVLDCSNAYIGIAMSSEKRRLDSPWLFVFRGPYRIRSCPIESKFERLDLCDADRMTSSGSK